MRKPPMVRPGALIPRAAFTRTTDHYVLAVLGYFVLGVLTKAALTWTMALLYFVLTLDVLPRVYRWARRGGSSAPPAAAPGEGSGS